MGEQRAIRFTQSDVSRAAKGLKLAGVDSFTLRIDPLGNMEIIAHSNQAIEKRGSSWDDVLDQ